MRVTEHSVRAQMPSLPPLDIKRRINHTPRVVLLGAGGGLASFPAGDANGRLCVIFLKPVIICKGHEEPYEVRISCAEL